MPHLLLVDDEEPLRQSLSFTLGKEGYAVTTASDGPMALKIAREDPSIDVIVLDIMLPGMNGTEVCKHIREFSDVPILLLTAKDHAADKVLGLELGADDYITKPFNTKELLARIKSATRRGVVLKRMLKEDQELLAKMQELSVHMNPGMPVTPAGASPDGTTIHIESAGVFRSGSIMVDIDQAVVTIDNRAIELNPEEFQLLRALISNKGRVVTRTDLIGLLWGEATQERLVRLEALCRGLCSKTEINPIAPKYISAIPGIGYQFD